MSVYAGHKVGDRVLVPFNISCGTCFFCARELYGNCHNTNPNATAVGGIYGYSHTAGGYDGGQAEYVRVPFADVGPAKIPDWMAEEDALMLTDACPTGYQAALMGEVKPGDTVVVFGAGPVGIFAAKSARLLGAARVIVVDHLDYRLEFVSRYVSCAECLRRARCEGGITGERPRGEPVGVAAVEITHDEN